MFKRIALLLALTVALWSGEAPSPFATNEIAAAEKLIGLEFTPAERELMLPGLRDQLGDFQVLRQFPLSNSVPPAIQFNPLPLGFNPPQSGVFKWEPPANVQLLGDKSKLAFYSVADLSVLIRSRKISSRELTRLFLDRLKRYGPKLECVVTLTEELALEQAAKADEEIAAGKYRGPLHGIPYGVKDLLATKGIKTTWGTAPYKDQVFDFDATVVTRLREAGAILVAKTTLGEVAMGDTWFGGKTRNPWNLEEGSSGSSAGSAAGVAAGLFPFAIGSETWGSIISPATTCGVTGLRPTYGRVSRHGAMSLSWTMDKIGPLCRTVEDSMLILRAIAGPDQLDQMIIPAALSYTARTSLNGSRIGYLEPKASTNKNVEREQFLDFLKTHGAQVVPVSLPNYPIRRINFVLGLEAATAFDELTRSNRDDQMVQQSRWSWPNSWREARFIPAVEYLQAQRIRHLLIQETAKLFEQIDCLMASPRWDADPTLLGNLTGHPCVIFPYGKDAKGRPESVTLMGKLFDEGEICSIAAFYQSKTEFHKLHPPVDW